MAKKYYAVRQGRNPGIYESWEDCKKQVDRFPCAQYKSFSSRQEAQLYLNRQEPSRQEAAAPDQDGAIAYVDGSYRADTGEFSCGVVLFYQGQEQRFSQKFSDPALGAMRNVAGEIMGATCAIKYCLREGIPNLVIYHDYEGIARWAQGDWKTNLKGTADYAAFCRKSSETMSISFVKVKGHSGDRYNELADQLAKQALGISV